MPRARRLMLVGNSTMKGLFMKVAFASSDNQCVDEHFGQAERFCVWDISTATAAFSGLIQLQQTPADEADRIESRCAALQDCALVYVAQIGGPAAARLVAKRIHPIKSKDNEKIESIVEKLQQVLRDNPPPWLRKAMLKAERPAVV